MNLFGVSIVKGVVITFGTSCVHGTRRRLRMSKNDRHGLAAKASALVAPRTPSAPPPHAATA